MLRTRDGRAINPGSVARPDRQSLCPSTEDLGALDVTRRGLSKVSIAAGPHGRRRPPPI